MKQINYVEKKKARHLYMLESYNELDSFSFKDVIPHNAKKVEIKYVDANKILTIDYILSLKIQKSEKGEEGEKKNE